MCQLRKQEEHNPKNKSYDIPKALIWEAFQCVKEKGGAAGVDRESIEQFESRLGENLYKLWNRLCSGCYFPPAENAIRPFVIGRKNWLFSGHPNVANASATLFSIIESAKAAGLEPYACLRYLFEKIPLAKG